MMAASNAMQARWRCACRTLTRNCCALASCDVPVTFVGSASTVTRLRKGSSNFQDSCCGCLCFPAIPAITKLGACGSAHPAGRSRRCGWARPAAPSRWGRAGLRCRARAAGRSRGIALICASRSQRVGLPPSITSVTPEPDGRGRTWLAWPLVADSSTVSRFRRREREGPRMKHTRIASGMGGLLTFGLAALLAATLARAQAAPPEIAFDSVPDFLRLPDGMYLGEVSGVALDSHRNIFVFSRGNTTGPAYGAAAAQLLEFDSHGRFMREIGHNLYAWSFAHAVRVDRHDNIWATDKGSDEVVRFNPKGRVTLVLGRKSEASDEGAHPLAHPRPPLPPVDGL